MRTNARGRSVRGGYFHGGKGILPVRQSTARRELERRFGLPLEALVLEALNRHGSQVKAAAAIGANPKTFARWTLRLGVQRRYVLPAPTGSHQEERQTATAA